jgi:hypothetical protein
MDSGQDMSGNDKENVSGEALEDLGMSKEPMNDESHEMEGHESAEEDGEHSSKKRPTGWERLKKKTRQQEREIQELHVRMAEMQSQLQPNQAMQQPQQSPYDSGNPMQQQPQQVSGNMDMIQQAVSYALQQKEMEERKANEAKAQQHILKQYQDLNKHLDSTADKYDDFEEIVRGEAPFTPVMRDIALTLPKKGAGSAGEVLYRLGKNPEELSRISKLHPVDQAAELIALSHALISGGEHKAVPSRPLGQIKSNPVVNSVGVTEKTSPAQIRALMKEGKFK